MDATDMNALCCDAQYTKHLKNTASVLTVLRQQRLLSCDSSMPSQAGKCRPFLQKLINAGCKIAGLNKMFHYAWIPGPEICEVCEITFVSPDGSQLWYTEKIIE